MAERELSSSPASSTDDHGVVSGSPATMSTGATAELRVWIVRWDYYDDWGIEAVFTTEERAREFADALNADPDKRLGSASVEAHEVQS